MSKFKLEEINRHHLKQEKIELINDYFYIISNTSIDKASKEEILNAIEQDIIRIEKILEEE